MPVERIELPAFGLQSAQNSPPPTSATLPAFPSYRSALPALVMSSRPGPC